MKPGKPTINTMIFIGIKKLIEVDVIINQHPGHFGRMLKMNIIVT
jgi:hypothetical protein